MGLIERLEAEHVAVDVLAGRGRRSPRPGLQPQVAVASEDEDRLTVKSMEREGLR
jgi:hypothetical protein